MSDSYDALNVEVTVMEVGTMNGLPSAILKAPAGLITISGLTPQQAKEIARSLYNRGSLRLWMGCSEYGSAEGT
jgi:hypothetical protein